MRRKESLYAIIGGVVGAVLAIAVCSVMPIGAQNNDATFGHITCSGLVVVGADGKSTILLSGRAVSILGGVKLDNVLLTDRGLSVYDGAHELAYLRSNGHGGIVSVSDKSGERVSRMHVTEHGGYVSVHGKGNDDARVAMAVNEYGNGGVSTWDKNGYRLTTLK